MIRRYFGYALVFAACLAPSAHAYNLYAAVAYSDSTGRWGYSFDNYTLIDAMANAEAQCGVYDCEAKSYVMNGCTALARGYGWGLGWGISTSLASARYQAVRQCELRDYACSVVVWACTSGHS